MRPGQAAPGFTLIEMVVAVTIFAILVALTVPAMQTWVQNARVRSVADALQNGVRMAQAESLRRSRQVVFALTNDTAPQNATFTAADNGSNWAIMVVPAMADGPEATTPTTRFVESGVLASGNVQVVGPGAICFNSMGRLIVQNATGVAGVGCTLPPAGAGAAPPKFNYQVSSLVGANPYTLLVQVGLGGQVHICDPHQVLSNNNPYGCAP